MFVVLWSQWMNRVGIAWLLFYTRPYFFWCAFMLQPLEAVNNYECWTPWFYYDFSDISNKLRWFYGFLRRFSCMCDVGSTCAMSTGHSCLSWHLSSVLMHWSRRPRTVPRVCQLRRQAVMRITSYTGCCWHIKCVSILPRCSQRIHSELMICSCRHTAHTLMSRLLAFMFALNHMM